MNIATRLSRFRLNDCKACYNRDQCNPFRDFHACLRDLVPFPAQKSYSRNANTWHKTLDFHEDAWRKKFHAPHKIHKNADLFLKFTLISAEIAAK